MRARLDYNAKGFHPEVEFTVDANATVMVTLFASNEYFVDPFQLKKRLSSSLVVAQSVVGEVDLEAPAFSKSAKPHQFCFIVRSAIAAESIMRVSVHLRYLEPHTLENPAFALDPTQPSKRYRACHIKRPTMHELPLGLNFSKVKDYCEHTPATWRQVEVTFEPRDWTVQVPVGNAVEDLNWVSVSLQLLLLLFTLRFAYVLVRVS